MIKQILCFVLLSAMAATSYSAETGDYQINAGDILEIFVWNEETLTRDVRVRPDGFVSLPLAGEFLAGGQTPAQLTATITDALNKYLNDSAVVTVSVRAMDGNIIYVLGKVNRPGAFPVATRVDVTQALAWAGGLNTFADEDDIQVLRRDESGTQRAMTFDYSDVKSGENLESNIILQSGDVVIVP